MRSYKMYKLYISLPDENDQPTHVIHLETGRYIPFAPGNRDYQEYLEWLAEDNEPQPADDISE